MADVFDKNKRSEIMSRVLAKGNKTTELALISWFKIFGIINWQRSYPVKGHPDFVFRKQRIAIFVDGCFWHGHNCRNTRPRDNGEYWRNKRERNIQHDKEITALFEARGWKVIRIWECELKKKNLPATLERITSVLTHSA